MILGLDIGNTNIKSALFEGNEMSEFVVHSNSDKAINYLNQLDFKAAAICSVNPSVYKIIHEKISLKSKSLFTTDIQNKFNLKIKYETPSTLGMDRICSAVGALATAKMKKMFLVNQYLITIDFGTATTINIVSPEKEFIGGLIAPGINTMLNSLHQKTAQLPLPNPNRYLGLIGNSTNSSIVSGVINATIGMINRTVDELNVKYNSLPVIFVTGGNSNFIIHHLEHEVFFDEALVLKGLKFIYDLNK